MHRHIIGTTVLLTALLCGGCAATAPRRAASNATPAARTTADADLHCEPRTPAAHCITGEELKRFGARDTAEALRMAFPWIN